MNFRVGVLGDLESIKGFRVVASDGRAGRVSWASYAPDESYVVVTLGRLSRKHHVVPAAAVTSVRDGEVFVGLSRAEIGQLHDVPRPQIVADPVTGEQAVAAAMAAWARMASGTGGMGL